MVEKLLIELVVAVLFGVLCSFFGGVLWGRTRESLISGVTGFLVLFLVVQPIGINQFFWLLLVLAPAIALFSRGSLVVFEIVGIVFGNELFDRQKDRRLAIGLSAMVLSSVGFCGFVGTVVFVPTVGIPLLVASFLALILTAAEFHHGKYLYKRVVLVFVYYEIIILAVCCFERMASRSGSVMGVLDVPCQQTVIGKVVQEGIIREQARINAERLMKLLPFDGSIAAIAKYPSYGENQSMFSGATVILAINSGSGTIYVQGNGNDIPALNFLKVGDVVTGKADNTPRDESKIALIKILEERTSSRPKEPARNAER